GGGERVLEVEAGALAAVLAARRLLIDEDVAALAELLDEVGGPVAEGAAADVLEPVDAQADVVLGLHARLPGVGADLDEAGRRLDRVLLAAGEQGGPGEHEGEGAGVLRHGL